MGLLDTMDLNSLDLSNFQDYDLKSFYNAPASKLKVVIVKLDELIKHAQDHETVLVGNVSKWRVTYLKKKADHEKAVTKNLLAQHEAGLAKADESKLKTSQELAKQHYDTAKKIHSGADTAATLAALHTVRSIIAKLLTGTHYPTKRPTKAPTHRPTKGPTKWLVPRRKGLLFDVNANDFDPKKPWVDRKGVPTGVKSGTPELKEFYVYGKKCMLFNHDNDYFQWKLNVGPKALPEASFEVYFYLVSKANNRGWLFGDENGGCDRYILLHDDRVGGGRVSGSCMANKLNSTSVHVGKWNHVIAYYKQGVQEYVVVNGVKSRVQTKIWHNEGRGYLRLGSPWGKHYAHACVNFARVYNRELKSTEYSPVSSI